MNTFQAMVLDKVNDQTKLEIRQLSMDDLPDFILSQSHWIDAKLSEHTVFGSQTMQKYEPHIEKLTIIYLRKTSQLEYRRMVSPKTELVHISYILEPLAEERKSYYNEILKEIEKKTIKHLV